MGACGLQIDILAFSVLNPFIAAISFHGPPLGFYLQAGKVEYHLVACIRVRFADDAADVLGIVWGSLYDSVVAAGHQLVVDDNLVVEVDGVEAFLGDAAHVAAAVE